MDNNKKVTGISSMFNRIIKKIKKKTPVSTSSSSTSLVMPEVSSVAPINSTSSPRRFFEQDPPPIPDKHYDHRDLKSDERINNTLELAYLLQQSDLLPEKIKHLEELKLKVIQTFVKDEFKSS